MIIVNLSEYVKILKVKDGNKDKKTKDQCLSISMRRIYWKSIKLFPLDWRNQTYWFKRFSILLWKIYKNNIRKYDSKVHANFCGLDMPRDGKECESFKVISIYSLLLYHNKYYLQMNLNNYKITYKIANKEITDYLDENCFLDYKL